MPTTGVGIADFPALVFPVAEGDECVGEEGEKGECEELLWVHC